MHEKLGYYFIAFRALDETYFRYTDISSSSSSSSNTDAASQSPSSDIQQNDQAGEKEPKSAFNFLPSLREKKSFDVESRSQKSLNKTSTKDMDKAEYDKPEEMPGKRRKWKVDIVQGPKDGVEGVGVGAVNVYMAVFGDGIISVSNTIIRESKVQSSRQASLVSFRRYHQAHWARSR